VRERERERESVREREREGGRKSTGGKVTKIEKGTERKVFFQYRHIS
jgi:hypothetical protein